MKRPIAATLTLLLAFSSHSRGQDSPSEKSAIEQLLDELREKGVLSEDEYSRLRTTAAAEQSRGSVLAGYDKGFFIRSRDDLFSLRLTSYAQFRYSYLDQDEDVPDSRDDKSSFRLRRVQMNLAGTAFRPWVTYTLSWELAGRSPSLRDGYVDLYDKKNLPAIGLKLGQFKTPFSRQFLNSDLNSTFVERSIASIEFSFDRDQGVALHGKPFGGSPNLEYTTGLFNGNGQNQADNADTGLLFASRLDWNVLGEVGASEGDIECSADPRWAIGSSYAYAIVTPTTGPEDGIDVAISRWGADTSLKYMGFALQSEVYVSSETPERRPDGVQGVHASGTYAQASYFLVPKVLEIAARYSYVRPDVDDTPNRQEVTGGLHYYFAGHPWKLQLDVRRFTEARDPGVDERAIQLVAQMQVSF